MEAILDGIKNNFFISANFSDTEKDILLISQYFRGAGINVFIKHPYETRNSSELIKNCDVFISIITPNEGVIKTPKGDTLPQLELEYAINLHKNIIVFYKYPLETGATHNQAKFRRIIKNRLKESVLYYENLSQLPHLCKEVLIGGANYYAKNIKPWKIFLSHSSIDKPIIENIIKRLEKENIEIFYDKNDIDIGMDIKATIKEAISQVEYVLLFLSNNALNSKWVIEGMVWALEHVNKLGFEEDFILPIKIGEFSLSEEFKFLEDKHFIDLNVNFEDGIKELIKKITI